MVVLVTVVGLSSERQVLGHDTQLSALVAYSDGRSARNSTAQVAWATSDPKVVTVSPSGVMHGVSLGDAFVTATVDHVSGVARVEMWPNESSPAVITGKVLSTASVPVPGALVFIDGTETVADGGVFSVVVDHPSEVRSITAIHDDYDIGETSFIRQDVEGPFATVYLRPFPDRVYLRVRGENACTERPFVSIPNPAGTGSVAGRLMATFSAQHTGPFQAFGQSSYTDGTGIAVYRTAPNGQPVQYDKILDGGFAYTWLSTGDAELCPRPYDMMLAHPR